MPPSGVISHVRSTSDGKGTDMFTQLSLFDSAVSLDTVPTSAASFVPVSPPRPRSAQHSAAQDIAAQGRPAANRASLQRPAAEPRPSSPSAPSMVREPAGRQASGPESTGPESIARGLAAGGLAEERRVDEIRPMGELAQLVLARYDLLANRRQERDRRRREQPRKSIRVLSPAAR
jgi:hypothetical protein